MNIGDRVYHKTINGNGIIVTIDETKQRDKYGVQFFWKKYKSVTLHNLDGFISDDIGQWCSEDSLTLTPYRTTWQDRNKVTMMGNRSLDRLIQKICEIPHRQRNDGSDIIINYGLANHNVPEGIHVINRYLIMNKFRQCNRFAHNGVPVPPSTTNSADITGTGWIIKPYISLGGRNIHTLEVNDRFGTDTHYAQKRVNKVREFRAHVFMWANNTVPLIQEKIVDDTSQLCWNEKQGARFRYSYMPLIGRNDLGNDLIQRIKGIAHRACSVLGYDFGGVDLALDNEDQLWVFEINSRMGLREKSMAVYKGAFWELYNL